MKEEKQHLKKIKSNHWKQIAEFANLHWLNKVKEFNRSIECLLSLGACDSARSANGHS